MKNAKCKIGLSLRGLLLGAPAKANGLCGERKSQDTVGIFRLRKMEHCVLRFDDVAIRSSNFGLASCSTIEIVGTPVLLRCPVLSSATERLPRPPTAATRSGRFLCPRQRSPRSPRVSEKTPHFQGGHPGRGVPTGYFDRRSEFETAR